MAKKCSWTQDKQSVDNWDGDDSYDTDCGGKFELMNGTPSDNRMKFCPYCGRELVVKESS